MQSSTQRASKALTKSYICRLKQYQVMKSKIEVEYFKCEKELRDRTEEVEMLKTEMKDLRQILKLKEELIKMV